MVFVLLLFTVSNGSRFQIGIHVTFFMVAFVISFHGDYVGWQGDFNVAIYSLVE